MSNKEILDTEIVAVSLAALINALQRMLEFKYAFLKILMQPLTFRAIEVDTDFLYS